MQEISIFYDLLWHECFQLECESLEQAVKQEFEHDPNGRQVSNAGGWQSQDDIHTKNSFKNLVEIIERQLLQLHSDIELVDGVRFKIVNMWANINFPGCSNSLHAHHNPPDTMRLGSGAILSGTFYVKVPENSGDLVFYDTHEPLNKMSNEPGRVRIPEFLLKNPENFHIQSKCSFEPIEGDLMIWFADIFHAVETNRSDEERISISFNLGLEVTP
jgi:uncharacterized protein (TIGR02466 family)